MTGSWDEICECLGKDSHDPTSNPIVTTTILHPHITQGGSSDAFRRPTRKGRPIVAAATVRICRWQASIKFVDSDGPFSTCCGWYSHCSLLDPLQDFSSHHLLLTLKISICLEWMIDIADVGTVIGILLCQRSVFDLAESMERWNLC
jgi:hypothetical protein